MRSGVVFAIGLILVTGCSTTLEVREISGTRRVEGSEATDATGSDVDTVNAFGIPIRIKEPRTIRVFQKTGVDANGIPKYQEVFVAWKTLASQEKLYAVNYDSEYFSNHDVKFAINGDNTLRSVSLSEEIVVDKAISGFGGAALGVASAVEAFDETREAKAFERFEAEQERQKGRTEAAEAAADSATQEVERGEASLVAALESLNAVNLAQAALEDLDGESTASEQQTAVDNVRLAKFRANIAYRKAGLAEPYPEVFP